MVGQPVTGFGCQTGRALMGAGKSVPGAREVMARRKPKWSSHAAKKSLSALKPGCPYRKPTQVGWVSILRRTGEPSLRN